MLVMGIMLILTGCLTSQPKGIIDKNNYDTLLLDLESDSTRTQPGIPIQMRFTVKNAGERIWILESQDTPVMDIVILGIGDQVLASWSSRNPEQLSHRLEWKPGESKTIELIWIPTQADYDAGEYYRPLGVPRIYASGRLYENSRLVKGAGFELCFKTRC
jgi:hypothetical protein